MKRVLIWAAAVGLTACATAAVGAAERSEPCPPDTFLYSYRDTAQGVQPPAWLRSTTPPRPGFGRITAQGIVGPDGRVERRSISTFGSGGPDERMAAGDALFWSRFVPAQREGCAVRFLYRITFMAGIAQRVPDAPADTSRAGGR